MTSSGPLFLLLAIASLGGAAWYGGGRDSQSSPILFEDVTRRAGLEIERIVSPEKRYIVETMGGGAGFFDYNGDGWLDVYLMNSPTVESFQSGRFPANRLFRNNGDGSFSDVSAPSGTDLRAWGMGLSAADFDGDGHADLYLTNFGPNVLLKNRGDGTFEDVTRTAGVGDPRFSASSGWADYDRDGDLDLFVANYVEFDLDHLPAFGSGRYCIYKTHQVQCGPRGLKGTGDVLYRNNGDGTFTDVSREAGVEDSLGYYGLGVVWADFDLDGHPDLYVANDTNPNYLYWNRGDGTFEESGLLSGAAVDANGNGQAGMGIAAGDYDNNGLLDLYVTNFYEEVNALYQNAGGRVFRDRSSVTGKATYPFLGWGVLSADLDNDGWKDLFVANGHVYPQVDRMDMGIQYRQRNLVFRNLGNGAFEDVSSSCGEALQAARIHRGAAAADYDGDGDLDVLLLDLDGQPVLLQNRTAADHYLRVSAPVGSRVTIESAVGRQVDEIRASGSYLSASEPVAHFGLGRAAVLTKVTVRFPGGRTETREQIDANQTLRFPAGP